MIDVAAVVPSRGLSSAKSEVALESILWGNCVTGLSRIFKVNPCRCHATFFLVRTCIFTFHVVKLAGHQPTFQFSILLQFCLNPPFASQHDL